LGGAPPSAKVLQEAIRAFDAARASLRALRKVLSPRAFSEALARFHFEGLPTVLAPPSLSHPISNFELRTSNLELASRLPLAIVGSPFRLPDFRLFDLVEKASGFVALDATASGEASLPAPADASLLVADPLEALVQAYFDTIPDAFRRPNTRFYEWLGSEIERRGIRGVIFRNYVWCDTWRAEAQRLKEWAPVPVLVLDSIDEENADSRVAARIQAFLEMLR
jgi:benzoyl-CoA reductase/2-hydroxyglutaryl-CoA dehydratase subunit BcrC/BadD/HgdB